ncbi:unnamed protein product [Urochloa decumbens]|uniref:FBD domain-containing protein n=1 Tax=Urochloa decumbens TaxID=240449 RepID=A0ABC8YJU4_9POAL
MESRKDDGVDEATTQPTEPTPPADDQAAADLLSGLCDDVLVHILGLTKHARDTVRTGALSRRWRGLWQRAPALRFASRRWFKCGGSPHGFIAFVDDTLALHAVRSGGGGVLEQLVICLLDMDNDACHNKRLVTPSVGAAERWILYAARHGVKSFHFEFELYLPGNDDDEENEETRTIALDELPSSAKLEAMYLDLDDAWVRLPATVVFVSLTDLALESIKVAGDNVLLLSRLVSSACCPNLQKLRMWFITLRHQQQNLLLEAGALTELSLYRIDGMTSLEVNTPSLRVLLVEGCDHLGSLEASAPSLEKLHIEGCEDLESFVASAPRLEKLSWKKNGLLIIDQDFPSVSRLKLHLYSHGYAYGDDSNCGSINLLQRCSSASCLSIDLHVSMREGHDIDTIKGWIPQVDRVRSLKAHITSTMKQNRQCFVNCVASLLTSFNNIRFLRLDFYCFKIQQSVPCSGSVRKSNFICDHWKSHEISLVHLTEAQFSRLPRTGADCALRFLQYVLSGAAQLQKVIISFNQKYSLKSGCDDFREVLLPSGTWTDCHDTIGMYRSYEWRPCQ